MKRVDRLSLISKGGRRESDAEHTWHLVMFIWMFSYLYERNIDLLKAIKMGLVHDLVEIQAGDVYGLSSGLESRKKAAEKKAALSIFGPLPEEISKELTDLWYEYERKETEESKFVWALDKICPRFQLALTENDLSEGLPDSDAKREIQELTISNISPIFKYILEIIKQQKSQVSS